MAVVNRRRFVAALSTLTTIACVPHRSSSPLPSDPPPQQRDRVLVVLPDSVKTRQVRASLVDELENEFDLVTVWVGAVVPPESLRRALLRVAPRLVILMNNTTLQAYGAVQNQPGDWPPAVVLMASYLDHFFSALKNTSGVVYEIPGVVQFLRLRSLVSTPIRKVGVLHRAELRQFVRSQSEQAQREHIELEAREMPRHFEASDISTALSELRWHEQVDALWVLNDNPMLRTELLREAWLPSLQRGKQLPVLVGIEPLVQPALGFGSFAMLPDHSGLGVQAANIVLELADQNWQMGEPRMEYPVAVETVVNWVQAQRYFGLRENAQYRADRLLE